MSAVPPVAIPAPPAHVPGVEPRDDDPPSPTYLGVGPGADWFADGGHEPITDVGVLGTVVSTAPQWPSHPEF